MVFLLCRLDDEGIGAYAGRRQQEIQVRDAQRHSAEVHAQHQQHAEQHDAGPQPVGEIELLVIQRHRGEVHHQHVRLQKRGAGAQRASGVAEVCEQIQQEAENADRDQDQHGLSLMKEAFEIAVRQQLDRQEHQCRQAQEKARQPCRARGVHHDLADCIID